MRTLAATLYIGLATFLFSCDQPPAITEEDLKLGLECFENHRASLPPGTQYEGVAKRSADRLTIKVMNGVEVVTMDCK